MIDRGVTTMDLPEMSADEWSFLEDLPHSVGSDDAIPASLLDETDVSVDGYADGRRVVTDCLFPAEDDDEISAEHATVLSRFDASLNPSRPKFIWEKGGFMSNIFGKKQKAVDLVFGAASGMKRPLPPFCNDFDEVDELGRGKVRTKATRLFGLEEKPLFFRVLKRASTCEDDDSKRQGLCSGWASILILNLEAFTLGQNLIADRRVVERADVLESVNYCIAGKATSTVLKRLQAMVLYAKYGASHGIQMFPLSEAGVYAYMDFLVKDSKSKPTSGKSFLEAVRFAGGVFGLRGFEGLTSTRVAGAAEKLARTAPPTSQAAPLSVEQVKVLEHMACDAESMGDRVLLGGMLIMLYGCARNSDVARATEIRIDLCDFEEDELGEDEPGGYIELSVVGSKGARSVKLRRAILPVVAPMLTVSGRPWWTSWMDARRSIGASFSGELDKPILCRLSPLGEPEPMSLQATETGAMLRCVLGVPSGSTNTIRSHSLKVTCLSWLAKYGIPLEYRRSLGHHLDVSAQSAECYSRDAMAPALRKLCEVVKAIERGNFSPDATRSGRFKKVVAADRGSATTMPVVALRPLEDKPRETAEAVESEANTDSVAGDSTDSDESSDAEPLADIAIPDTEVLTRLTTEDMRPKFVAVRGDTVMWRHSESGKQHLQILGQDRLVCGRIVSSNYSKSADAPIEECVKCHTCFSSKDVAPSDDEM